MARRQSINVEGFGHSMPIPAACRIDNIVTSGLVTGLDPATGRMAATIETQCANMFATMRRLVEAAGGTVEDIVKLTVWLNDRAQRDIVNVEWLRMFPDAESRPARSTLNRDLGGGKYVECEFTAVLEARS